LHCGESCRQPDSRVADRHHKVASFSPRCELMVSSRVSSHIPHRVNAIHHEIHQHLLQLHSISQDVGKICRLGPSGLITVAFLLRLYLKIFNHVLSFECHWPRTRSWFFINASAPSPALSIRTDSPEINHKFALRVSVACLRPMGSKVRDLQGSVSRPSRMSFCSLGVSIFP